MKVVTGKITNNESVSCGIDSSEGYAQTRVKTKTGTAKLILVVTQTAKQDL